MLDGRTRPDFAGFLRSWIDRRLTFSALEEPGSLLASFDSGLKRRSHCSQQSLPGTVLDQLSGCTKWVDSGARSRDRLYWLVMEAIVKLLRPGDVFDLVELNEEFVSIEKLVLRTRATGSAFELR